MSMSSQVRYPVGPFVVRPKPERPFSGILVGRYELGGRFGLGNLRRVRV